jgi:hypothetical protein
MAIMKAIVCAAELAPFTSDSVVQAVRDAAPLGIQSQVSL